MVRAIVVIVGIVLLLLSVRACTNFIFKLDDQRIEFEVSSEQECISNCLINTQNLNRTKVTPIYYFEVNLGEMHVDQSPVINKRIKKTCECIVD